MGFRSKRRVIAAKTPGELDAMQAAGEILGRALGPHGHQVTGHRARRVEVPAVETAYARESSSTPLSARGPVAAATSPVAARASAAPCDIVTVNPPDQCRSDDPPSPIQDPRGV